MENRLFVVIPCYNEEEVLPETSRRISEKMRTLISAGKIAENSRVVLVNDGSRDKTWEIIRELHERDSLFSGVNLSRNRGHQNALLAGLMSVKDLADMTISMDADLQDDIDAIDEMVDCYLEGCDVVYGVRSSREKDSFFKRFTAESFYKLIRGMGGEVVFNHADYRLLSRRALLALSEFGETNLFLRGIIPMLGFKTDIVTYERGERFAGESKYPLKKMLAFAIEGITSLSAKPMRLIFTLGVLMLLAAFIILVAAFVRILTGAATGFVWISFSIWAVGGLILTSLGVVGEYVGKIYLETKKRPRFIVESFLHRD
ncbi:MAG TPA: glycosyltransferase family 2 protein [Clostridiales bacterium]|jgi:glycosyltransferase involved in cell wall biosynthesis|nr:glycosyltransferase family 2 protein [Clostridiales bacterium]